MIFNGRTYVKIAHCDDYNIGSSVFTLEVRLKVDPVTVAGSSLGNFTYGPYYSDLSKGGGIFCKRSSWHLHATGTPSMFITNDGRVLALASKSGSAWDAFYFATPPNSIKEGQWHDVVLMRKADGWAQIYVDGKKLAIDNVGVDTAIISTLDDVLIGATYDVEPNASSETRLAGRFVGEIDRLRFSNIVREISTPAPEPSADGIYTHENTDYTFTTKKYYHAGNLSPATANQRIKEELGEEWEHANWEDFSAFSIQDWMGFLDAVLPIHKPHGADSFATAAPLMDGSREMNLGWLPISGSYTRSAGYSYFLSFANHNKAPWYASRANYHNHFMDIGGWSWTGPYVAKRVKQTPSKSVKVNMLTAGWGDPDHTINYQCPYLRAEFVGYDTNPKVWRSVKYVVIQGGEHKVEKISTRLGGNAPGSTVPGCKVWVGGGTPQDVKSGMIPVTLRVYITREGERVLKEEKSFDLEHVIYNRRESDLSVHDISYDVEPDDEVQIEIIRPEGIFSGGLTDAGESGFAGYYPNGASGHLIISQSETSGQERTEWVCDDNTLIYVDLKKEESKPKSNCATLHEDYKAGQKWLTVTGGKQDGIYKENALLKIGDESPFEYTNTVIVAMTDCYLPPGRTAPCENSVMISLSVSLKKSYPKGTLVCLGESISLPEELRLNSSCAPIFGAILEAEGCDGNAVRWTINDVKVIQFRLETDTENTSRHATGGSCVLGEKNIIVLVDGKPWWDHKEVSPSVSFGYSVKNVVSCKQYCQQTPPSPKKPDAEVSCVTPRIMEATKVGPFVPSAPQRVSASGLRIAVVTGSQVRCGTRGTGFVTGRWAWHLTKAKKFVMGGGVISWRSNNMTLTKKGTTPASLNTLTSEIIRGVEIWELIINNFSDLTNTKGCKPSFGTDYRSTATKKVGDSDITFNMGYGTVTIEFDCVS